MKKQEGKKKEVLLLILHKEKEHNKVLSEIRENVLMLNTMSYSHVMFILLVESKIDKVFSSIYP